MAEQVEELVVAAKAEGLEETSEGFEEMESNMDEVADGMEDTTGQLAELEQRFTGAMGAILVGIGALTAGLLSQIPVVGEVLAGLGSVVDAIAFRLDERLRPALEPIADAFFKISEAIFELDGPLGKLFDSVLVGSVAFGLLAGAVGAIKLAMTGLAAVVAGLSAPFLIVAGAVGLLVGAIATDFLGIRSRLVTTIVAIKEALKPVADILVDIATSIADIGGSAIEFTVDLIGNAIDRVMQISDFSTDIVGEIYEFTVNLIGNAISLVEEISSFVTDVLGGIYEFTVNLIGDALDSINTISSFISDTIGRSIAFFVNLLGDALDGINTISSFISDTIGRSIGFFVNILGNALDVVKNILDKLQKIVGKTWNSVVEIALELLNSAKQADPTGAGGLPGIVDQSIIIADIVEDTLSNVPIVGGLSSGGGGLSQASGQSAMFLDGRRVDEQTGRHAQSRYVRR